MYWLDEVKQNIKKRRQVLFSKDSEFLSDLAGLFAARSHRVMVLWALDFAAESVAELERAYPGERRQREAGRAFGWARLPVRSNRFSACWRHWSPPRRGCGCRA